MYYLLPSPLAHSLARDRRGQHNDDDKKQKTATKRRSKTTLLKPICTLRTSAREWRCSRFTTSLSIPASFTSCGAGCTTSRGASNKKSTLRTASKIREIFWNR